MDDGFNVGDKVSLLNPANLNDEGIIRYKGAVENLPGTYFGVELKVRSDSPHTHIHIYTLALRRSHWPLVLAGRGLASESTGPGGE